MTTDTPQTPRARAILDMYRLIATLRALPVDDRAAVVALLGEELRGIIRGLAAGD